MDIHALTCYGFLMQGPPMRTLRITNGGPEQAKNGVWGWERRRSRKHRIVKYRMFQLPLFSGWTKAQTMRRNVMGPSRYWLREAIKRDGQSAATFSSSVCVKGSECTTVKLEESPMPESAQHLAAPKPFHQIPGPLSLPFVGTLYKYLPWGKFGVRHCDALTDK